MVLETIRHLAYFKILKRTTMTTVNLHEYTHFLGIDVSKLTLDFCLIGQKDNILERGQISNNPDSWSLIKNLMTTHGLSVEKVLICGEHTGMYTYHLMNWVTQGAHVWVESGKAIKHSQGISRGKTDGIDAMRIALYAQRFVKKAQLWQPLSETIETLRYLRSLRERLLLAFNAIAVPMKEQKDFMKDSHFQMLEKLTDPATDAIKEQIQTIEQKIMQTIENDDNLKNQLALLDSIPGIGVTSAIGLIIKTQGFTAFQNGRQFACHAGIAPFDYRSGTSVKAKMAVSFHADKELKAMLHLCAMASIRTKGIIQDYYQRKVLEGKSKMSALNAVRNKIVLIAFSVIKNNNLFDNNFQFSFEIS
jgi:transposase